MKLRNTSASLTLFALSAVLFLILFLPFSFRMNTDVQNVIDPLFYAWNLDHNADVITKGHSLTDTTIYHPMTNTLAFSDTLWAQSILATPIIILTGNPILATNLSVFITFPIAAVTMYFLVFHLTSHRIASLFAGILYAFSYPRLSQLGHVPAVSSQWLPLVFLGAIRFIDTPVIRNLFFMSFFALLSFASSIYFGIFLAIGLPILSLPLFISQLKSRKKGYIKTLIRSSVILSIPVLIAGAFLAYPYLRLKAEHPEYRRSLSDIHGLRASPSDYLNVLPTSLTSRFGMPTADPEHVLFPTFTVLLLALIGLVFLKKNERLTGIVFFAIAFISFILSLGDETVLFSKTVRMPYYYLFSYISLFQTIRVPARLGILVMIGLSVLAGYGIRTVTLKSKILILGVGFLFFFEIFQTGIPSVSVPQASQIPAVYKWLKTQPDDTVIAEVPLRRFWNGFPMEIQLATPYGSLSEMHNYATETYRVYFSSFHGKKMINGYSGFFPLPYTTLTELLEFFPENEAAWTELKNRSVSYVIVHFNEYGYKRTAIESILSARSDIRRIQDFGADSVYEIIY